MRPMVGPIGRHAIPIGKLPVDLRVKVRECDTEIGVELPYTRLVRRGAWLLCVVNEIVGEKFFEDIEVSPALDFFGISTNNSFCASDEVVMLI